MLIFSTYNLLKGLFVAWNVIFDTANASRIQGKLPDLSLISTLFNVFLKPYLKTWHSESANRAFEDVFSTVERVVRQKVKELQPFLQDDDIDEMEMDNEITFEGNDETTIIEFLPQTGEASKTGLRHGNDTFKANLRKYKRLRNKINEALEVELVSNETKNLVMRTLDELLSKMVETQCRWKGGMQGTIDGLESYDDRFIVPRTIVKMWNEEWQKFKTDFSEMIHLRAKDKTNHFNILMTYLAKLNKIMKDVSMNLETMANKYKIRCNISDKKTITQNTPPSPKPESFRFSYESDNEKKTCKNFKVCSKELKTFFTDFYKSLNETSVNALRSYAEMFIRDVNTDDSNEKSSIIDIIINSADQTEKNIIEIFINHTNKFHLDEHKEKQANINYLLDFIKHVIKSVKGDINKNMFSKLSHLQKKVSSSIQQDVEVNLDVDLGNLERDLTSKICLIFSICNGNVKHRRHGDNEVVKESSVNENKIYVKVELTVDEEDNILLKSTSDTFDTVPKSQKKKKSNSFGKPRNVKLGSRSSNIKKYANISVTRTTLIKPYLK